MYLCIHIGKERLNSELKWRNTRVNKLYWSQYLAIAPKSTSYIDTLMVFNIWDSYLCDTICINLILQSLREYRVSQKFTPLFEASCILYLQNYNVQCNIWSIIRKEKKSGNDFHTKFTDITSCNVNLLPAWAKKQFQNYIIVPRSKMNIDDMCKFREVFFKFSHFLNEFSMLMNCRAFTMLTFNKIFKDLVLSFCILFAMFIMLVGYKNVYTYTCTDLECKENQKQHWRIKEKGDKHC